MTTRAPMAPSNTVAPVTPDEPTIGRLVADASRDISSLLQNEIALAKSELKVSVKNGGTGAGLFAAAGFLGLLAFIGVRKVKKVRAPERAIHQAQETKQLLKRG